MLTWGWRIPFLISFVLLALGLFVRIKISESPLFVQLAQQARFVRESERGAVEDLEAVRRGRRGVVGPTENVGAGSGQGRDRREGIAASRVEAEVPAVGLDRDRAQLQRDALEDVRVVSDDPGRACIPDGATAQKTTEAIVEYLKTDKDRRDSPAEILVGHALKTVYPCKS